MTIASSLIQTAYRELNVIPVGGTPSSAQQTEGLLRLNNLIRSVYGYEMGENLKDWLAPSTQRTAAQPTTYPQFPYACDPMLTLSASAFGVAPYPPKNSRIVWGGVTMAVYFPDNPQDGSRMAFVQGTGAGDSGVVGAVLTLNGNGRTIAGSATPPTITNPGTPRAWLYRADLGDWKLVADLLIGDDCQFPSDFDDFFTTALAMRLAPPYNKVVASETLKTGLVALNRLKARYRQAGITVYGAENYPNSFQSYVSGRPWW